LREAWMQRWGSRVGIETGGSSHGLASVRGWRIPGGWKATV
jgi:hypothetical protein